MVRIRTSEDPILDIPEGFIGHGHGQVPCGGAPPNHLAHPSAGVTIGHAE
jgi:hypothetical protein